MNTTVKLNTMTLESILSSKKIYILPAFQRDYSWSNTEWIELMEDAEKCFNSNTQHFFGFMTFKSDKGKSITIIVSIIRDILSVLNSEVSKHLDAEFIKSKDPYSTDNVMFYRLELANYNQSFFQKHIQDCENPKEKLKSFKSEKRLNYTQKLIINCYKYFHEYFIDKSKDLDSNSQITYLTTFVQRMLQNFVIVSTEVKDELAAYNIFQTLNNRGLDLNLSDLIKVYLFSCAKNRIKEVEQKWEDIRLNIELVNGNEFFRHYWLSKYDVVRGVDLLKVIENKIKDEYHVISFLNEISSESVNFSSLLFPNKFVWDDDKIIEVLGNIHTLSKQLTLPVLLAMKNVFDDEKTFLAGLNIITNFTFRYLTIGDKEHKTFERAPLAKYVLGKIEKHLSEENEKFSRNITLEHILPKKPNEDWNKYLESEEMEFGCYIHKIGNLTLLNKRPNGQIQNKFITEKSQMIEECSNLKISESLKGKSTWNHDDIYTRSMEFAEQAINLWEI